MVDSINSASPLELDSGNSSQAGDNDSSMGSETSSLRTFSATSSIYKYRFEDGRRYHAYDDGRYLLPNDETEQDRLDLQHYLFRLTLDGPLYRAPIPKGIHNVLDVGTGTGIWAMEFAEEHPSANVLGIDLSPIQPAAVPLNCSFRVDNAEAEWMADEKYDFIHSRAMIGGFKDWSKFFEQAFKQLTPGGYIELQDLCFPTKSIDPSHDSSSAMIRWSNHAIEAGRLVGIDIRAPLTWPEKLRAAGFVDVHLKWYNWPVGPWAKQKKNKEIGKYCLADFHDAVATPVALFTKVLGWSIEEFDEFLKEVREEQQAQKLHLYNTVAFCYARKPGWTDEDLSVQAGGPETT